MDNNGNKFSMTSTRSRTTQRIYSFPDLGKAGMGSYIYMNTPKNLIKRRAFAFAQLCIQVHTSSFRCGASLCKYVAVLLQIVTIIVQ